MQQDLESGRMPQDLGHLGFQSGRIGELITLSQIPVVAGDSFEQQLVGSVKFSPMRRNLTLDAKIDVFTFFVPHRHIYTGQQGAKTWVEFMKEGASTPRAANILNQTKLVPNTQWATLGLSRDEASPNESSPVPLFMHDGYQRIWANYFAWPEDWADVDLSNLSSIGSPLRCAHLKSIWNCPIPNNKKTENEIINGGGTLTVYEVSEQFGKHHTDEERAYFAQRYRDVMKRLFNGNTTADVDERPTLLGRSSQWASGYDVDGTGETSLGQYTGRVVTNINHNVPRRFIPEHGCVWTVAVVRYPTIVASENHYLLKNTLSYEQLACDPAILNNMPPITIRRDEFFNGSDVAQTQSREFSFGQWYREQPPFVSNKYTALNGYPFLKSPPNPLSTDEWFYINPENYDDIFQTTQLDHWNAQYKNNVTVIRAIPSARNSLMAGE